MILLLIRYHADGAACIESSRLSGASPTAKASERFKKDVKELIELLDEL